MAIVIDNPATVTDFRRDQWGRPLIVPASGGKAKPYTRSSSAAKTIEDTWSLEMWARRNVVYGLAHDASLVARVLAVGGDPGTWDKDVKHKINAVHEDAQKVAQSHKAADIGSAVHLLTERLDRGETVVGGMYQADLDAYRQALDAAGLTCRPEWVECRMVCDELEMAGTADRILTDFDGPKIADLKTGPTVDYGGLGWAAQLATYAHSHLYDVTTDQRTATPNIDRTVGIIIHLPAGQGHCTLYRIDLVAGYRAAQLANEIRAVRKASKRWITPLDTVVVPAAVSTPDLASTPDAGRAPSPTPSVVGEVDRPTSVRSAGVGSAPSAPANASGAEVEPDHDRRGQLRARYKALSDEDKQRFLALDAGFDLDAIETALDQVDPFTTVIPPVAPAAPAPPTPPPLPILSDIDQGAVIPRHQFNQIRAQFNTLPDDHKTWIHTLLEQSRNTAVPIAPWPNSYGSDRSLHLLTGLVTLAAGRYGVDDQLAVEVAATAMNSDLPFQAATAGQAVGILNAAAAARFGDLCQTVAADIAAVNLRPQPAT